ncbi:sodium:solute symporter family protein [Acetobacter oeni]|uniref:Sodium:solute symporter n=1 Tax=Acetobacter oeni TaxID=304077 RepID=A0A511XJA4_9PROT|nr:sodium:solute symporter [Acetobacter oeni]MBB3882788.1 SSS family solute:Na+ symporter [Acetobacter oeni]NHO18879.1 sodium:solute symporter [Acetobacter oeni]GBR09527.1 Na+/solute symporter [Acetobacter oeni LMG 21952]GEN63026.1 sodium:solute symporter [Acetobacter oeni]
MASAVFAAIILLSFVVALLSRRNHTQQDSRDFFTASGQFGGLLVFLLTVGETYSIGSIMGFPAAAMHQGLPFIDWFLGYIVLAYPVGYFLNPLLWKAGKHYGALTFADLFRAHYQSRFLEIAVTLSTIFFLLPLGELQMAGLLTTIEEFHWSASPLTIATGAALLTFSWLALSGVRAPAFVSAIKDSIVVIAIALIAFAVLRHSSWHDLAAASRAMPLSTPKGNVYALTTILTQALGFCVAPQTIAFIFTAKSARTVRRNQIVMPLYMLMFPLLLLSALYASATGLPVTGKNSVFIAVASALLPSWGFGLVAAACALSGLVILAGICLSIGSLVSHNLVQGLPDARQKSCAKIVITLYLIFSVYAAMHFSILMPELTTVYYFGITQLFPAVLCMVLRFPVPADFVAAGFLAGETLSLLLAFFDISTGGVNVGFIGLLLNAAIAATGYVRSTKLSRPGL